MLDSWIPNHPTKKVLIHLVEEEWEWRVSDLMESELKCWNRELIMSKFHRDDAEATLRIPLSKRQVEDLVMWLHTPRGIYSVKLGYYVAAQILRKADWAKSSRGQSGNKVWEKLWKLRVSNKIKVFGWRACQNILPTQDNLVHRRILMDNTCELCKIEPKIGVHALWECGVARDVWVSSSVRLKNFVGGQRDFLQLFEELLDRLSKEEVDLQAPAQLNERASDMLAEFQQAQDQLGIVNRFNIDSIWSPPPILKYKLNFDAAIFVDLQCSGFGAVIRNDKGEIMGAMSAKGP
nr:uncharacterized protein LOC112012693 [Quercus suber]